MTERKADLKFGVDGSAVKPGLEQIKRDVDGMSDDVVRSGRKASEGIEGIGKSAPVVTQRIEAEARKWVQSVQRATAATDAGTKSGAEFLQSLGRQRGLSDDFMQPYINGLRRAEEAQKATTAGMGKMQVSAAQTAAALRNVPAQFTDIVVSLQAGQAPLTVLLQQGGQLKDMFGGAGNAAKALGGYILGLVTPVTVAAGAVAGLVYAIASSESEARKLSSISIAFQATGRSALLTADEIRELRKEMALLPGVSKESAGTVISEFARTREIGASVLKGLSRNIADFAVALGQDVPAAAKTLAKAFADPAKGAKDLDDALGFLTSNQLLAINAMVEAGDRAGAQKLMLEALATATKGLANEGTALEKATKEFGRAWTDAMNRMDSRPLNVLMDRLADLVNVAAKAMGELHKMRLPAWLERYFYGGLNGVLMGTSAEGYDKGDPRATPAPALVSQPANWNGGKGKPVLGIGDLGLPDPRYTGSVAPSALRIDYTPKAPAGVLQGAPTPAPVVTSKELDEQVKSIIEANKQYKSQKSVVEDIRKDIDRTQAALKAVVADDKKGGQNTSERAEKLQEILDGQNEKLKAALKKGTTSGAAGVGQTEVAGILAGVEAQRAYLKALQENGAEATKQTEGQKLVIKLTKELETSMTGATRASKEKALAAAKERADVDQQVVAEERRIAGLERSKQAYAAVVDEVRKTADAINQQADEMAASNSMWGKGRVAVEQYRLALIQARLAEVDATSEGSYDPAYVAGLRAQEAAQTRKVNEARIADGKTLNEQADELLRNAQATAKVYGEEADLAGKTQLERAKIVARREVELRYAQRIAEVDKNTGATEEDKDSAKAKLREAERIESEQAVAKVVREDWDKTADQINQSLTDALMQGFESGKSMGKSLADSLKNTFKTLVLRPVINAVMSPAAGVVNALFSGGGGGGGVGGGGSSLLGLASNASSLYNGASAVSSVFSGAQGLGGLSSFSAGYSGAVLPANMVGPSIQAPTVMSNLGYLSNTGSLAGGGSGAGAGAGMGSWGAGGIAALIMLAVINAVGGMRSERMIGSGLAGKLGGKDSLTPWEEWREGGTLVSGPDFTTGNPLEVLKEQRRRLQAERDAGRGETNYAVSLQATVESLEKSTKGLATQTAIFDREIQKGYKAYRSNVVDMANSLGLAGDSLKDFVYDIGAQDLNFKDLKPEEIQAKIQETFGKAGTEMVKGILGSWREVTDTIVNTWSDTTDPQNVQYTTETTVNKRMEYVPSAYAKEGETAIQTLERLAKSFHTLNEAADALGFGVQQGSLALADFADDFIEAFGGLERFTTQTNAFLQNFYSDGDRREAGARSAARSAERLGLQGITAEGILQIANSGNTQAVVDAVNSLVTNPELYADAMEWANGIAWLFQSSEAAVPAVQEVANVVDELTQAYQNAVKSLKGEADSLAVEVLRAQGKEAEAKALEKAQYMAQFAGLDEVRRKEIETLYDANVATRAFIEGIKAAAQAQLDALAKLRTDSLALIDAAAGKTDAAMAAYERAADKERERLQGVIDATREVFQAAEDGAKSFFAEVESVARFQGQQGRDFIAQALASVQAGGELPDGQELSDAIAAVGKDLSSTQFATQADADFQRLVVANQLKGLKEASGDQMDTAEQQLKTLNDQVQWAREQVDLLRGIDSSLKPLPEAIAGLIAAYNNESRTRSNVGAKAIIGTGSAIYDKTSGTGLTSSGAFFDAADMAEVARDVIAANGAAGKASVLDALEGKGFTMAQYDAMFSLPPGTLEAEARALGKPIYHQGTPFVPETSWAVVQKGEAIIPTAYNPFAHGGAFGGGAVVAAMEAVRAELVEVRRQNDALQLIATRTADAVNGRPESPMLVETV